MPPTPYRGIVDAILSGDSLIVRFLPPCKIAIQIISLEHLVAPKIGLPDGSIQDEPYGFDSWNFLRKMCIGRAVFVSPNFRQTKNTRYHPAFGDLPISFTRVSLSDEKSNNPDIGTLAVQAGWVKLRQCNSSNQDPYVTTLKQYEEQAKQAHLGIWSSTPGLVRHLPTKYTDEDIFSKREFRAIVKGVKYATTLSFFLLPDHHQIQLQLAGCKHPGQSNDPSKNYANDAKIQAIRTYLHREATIRICQKDNNTPFAKGEQSYIGCFVGGADRPIIGLIERGLALFYPKTSDFAPNADLYIEAENKAKRNGVQIWENAQLPKPKELKEFEGICTSIRSSSSMFLTNGDERQLFYLASVKVPYFFYNGGGGGCDSLGFEAREFLRKNYHGKTIRAVPTGSSSNREYATLYCDGQCINVEIVKNGLAVFHEPYVGQPSEAAEQIKQAEQEAMQRKIGLHMEPLPNPFKIIDISHKSMAAEAQKYINDLKDKTFESIVEQVAPNSKFHILIPEKNLFIKTGINGLFPSNIADRFGNEARAFCQKNYLQCASTITIHDIDVSGNFFSTIFVGSERVNLGAELIKRGLAELHSKVMHVQALDPELVELQNQAMQNGLGVWSDKTRHLLELEYNKVEKVKAVAAWTPITYPIQFLGDKMDFIESQLNTAQLESLTSQDISNLYKNDCIVAKFNDHNFRSRIETFDETNTKVAAVKFIDWTEDNKEFNELFKLPESLKEIPPQSLKVRLGCLEIVQNEKNEENVKEIWSIIQDRILYMHLMYEEDVPNVLLTDGPNSDSNSLNAYLLSRGMAKFVDHPVQPEMQSIVDGLKSIVAESHEQ